MPGPHDFRRPRQCRSSRAPLSIAHEFDLALRPHAHTTSSRPPHPAPRFVTIGRNAPLHRGGMRAIKHSSDKTKSEIFFARHQDRMIALNRFLKLVFGARDLACPSGAETMQHARPTGKSHASECK